MNTRLRIKQIQPEAYKAMAALEKYMATTGLLPLHRELINIRASQLNGCAYCVNMHTKDARKLGETEQRLYLVSVWREARNLFTEEEQAILQLTEEVTLISQHGVSDATYDNAITVLGEELTAQVIMATITINAWTRIGVSTRMSPE